LTEIGGYETIAAWTGFKHEGRKGKYSEFSWNATHFSGINWDEKTKDNSIWKFKGKSWAPDADTERENYDYL